MSTFSTDCLLLCIEEMYSNLERKDTTMFIYYDTRMREFHLLGKRNNTNVISFVPYSFTCKSKSKLYSFIRFVICNYAKCILSLYNYDNFPENCEDISYDFIEKHQDNKDVENSKLTIFEGNTIYADSKDKNTINFERYKKKYQWGWILDS